MNAAAPSSKPRISLENCLAVVKLFICIQEKLYKGRMKKTVQLCVLQFFL